MEGQAINPLNLILVQKQTVQGPKASEGVLVEAPQTVSVQKQVAKVVEVCKGVILQELQMIILKRYREDTITRLHLMQCFQSNIFLVYCKLKCVFMLLIHFVNQCVTHRV